MREPVLSNPPSDVLETMYNYGGRFVQNLAACYDAADPDNATKLRCAFPEIFEKYDAMVPK